MAMSTDFLAHIWNIGQLGILLFCTSTAFFIVLVYCIRNIYFHPLSNFPGPKGIAASPVWVMRSWVGGNFVRLVKALHDEYGPVVRIAPNQLSFCSSTSWKDIYGHVPGRKTFMKSSVYEPLPGEVENIVSVANISHHALMRKTLSHGFSASALNAQEDRVQHFVYLLIHQIKIQCCEHAGDMVKWYNFATFDIVGELAFGEAFGSLESGKPHFWITILFDGIKSTNLLRAFEYIPPLRSFFRTLYKRHLLPQKVTAPRAKQLQYADSKIKSRLQNTPSRPDFLTKMIMEGEKNEQSFEELRSQASLLVIAGSETTATALSGITYYLCRTPHAYRKLADEIRGNFSSYSQINGRSTEALPYLKAVIEEGLRIFPPIPTGPPRVSPGEMVDGLFVPENTVVSVSSWAATHSEQNFHNPFKFIPERWLDPEYMDKKSASQPFLLGSRGCLGRNLALLELRLILTKILWAFDFELKDQQLDWETQNKSFGFWEKPQLLVRFYTRSEANNGYTVE